MNIAVCKVTLRIPGNRDLKGKRRVLASLCKRTSARYGVSVAEVDHNDAWQLATLGIACVSRSARHADEVMNNAITYIEFSREDIVVVDVQQETLIGF